MEVKIETFAKKDATAVIKLINRTTLPRLQKEGFDNLTIKEILSSNNSKNLARKTNSGFFM